MTSAIDYAIIVFVYKHYQHSVMEFPFHVIIEHVVAEVVLL